LADKALESGSVDKLVGVLSEAMSNGIRERFHHASETRKHADDSVAAGREYVKAYVIFTHYVEGSHAMIKGGVGHHSEGQKATKGMITKTANKPLKPIAARWPLRLSLSLTITFAIHLAGSPRNTRCRLPLTTSDLPFR